LRGKVPYKGKFVKVENIPTGEPIMLSAKEWQKRGRKSMRRNLLLYWTLMPVIIFPLWLGLEVITEGELVAEAFYFAFFYAFMFPGIMTIGMVVGPRMGRYKQRYTGLYENGLVIWTPEMRESTFIPYSLIRSFHVKDGRFNKTLMLDMLGFEKPQPTLGLKILRDDGLAMLGRRTFHGPGPDVPPELHVYGGRSSKVRSLPKGSDDPEAGKG
jgi:hypothetical protein